MQVLRPPRVVSDDVFGRRLNEGKRAVVERRVSPFLGCSVATAARVFVGLKLSRVVLVASLLNVTVRLIVAYGISRNCVSFGVDA